MVKRFLRSAARWMSSPSTQKHSAEARSDPATNALTNAQATTPRNSHRERDQLTSSRAMATKLRRIQVGAAQPDAAPVAQTTAAFTAAFSTWNEPAPRRFQLRKSEVHTPY